MTRFVCLLTAALLISTPPVTGEHRPVSAACPQTPSSPRALHEQIDTAWRDADAIVLATVTGRNVTAMMTRAAPPDLGAPVVADIAAVAEIVVVETFKGAIASEERLTIHEATDDALSRALIPLMTTGGRYLLFLHIEATDPLLVVTSRDVHVVSDETPQLDIIAALRQRREDSHP